MPDFYLVSTELREPYEPRACRIVRRLRSELRGDLALVEVEPPVPRHVYDTSEDVQWLILGSRHQGTSLFPVSEWPLAVEICRPKGNGKTETEAIASDTLAILDWGRFAKRGYDAKRVATTPFNAAFVGAACGSRPRFAGDFCPRRAFHSCRKDWDEDGGRAGSYCCPNQDRLRQCLCAGGLGEGQRGYGKADWLPRERPEWRKTSKKPPRICLHAGWAGL